ncbi:MAG TPA: hypothetical protein VK463_12275 [Desulfomonilaceae bacterium]|nr:hypothetical protein [Desulfomonilaceae bacterium]
MGMVEGRFPVSFRAENVKPLVSPESAGKVLQTGVTCSDFHPIRVHLILDNLPVHVRGIKRNDRSRAWVCTYKWEKSFIAPSDFY